MTIAYRNPLVLPIHELGWVRPAGNRDYADIRPFGDRSVEINGTFPPHNGIDLANGECGGAVVAAAAGVVDYAAQDPASGYANIVILNHGTERTWYAHLAEIVVKAGQKVNAGILLGTVGKTGWATGCHLHYQRQTAGPGGTWVDVDPAPIVSFVERPLPDTSTGAKVNVKIEAVYLPSAQVHFNAGTYTAYRLDGTTKKVTVKATMAHANALVSVSGLPYDHHYYITDGIWADWFMPLYSGVSLTH